MAFDAVVARFLDGFSLSRGTTDLDGDGIDDVTRAGTRTRCRGAPIPMAMASRDGLDAQPRMASSASAGARRRRPRHSLRPAILRRCSPTRVATLSSFDLGGFGAAGFYQLRGTGSPGSLSLWFDAGHRQFWGVTPVVQTLLDARDLPEGRAVWSKHDRRPAGRGLAPDASDNWLRSSRCAARPISGHLPLGRPDAALRGRGVQLPAGSWPFMP